MTVASQRRALEALVLAYEEHTYGGSFSPPLSDFASPLVWVLSRSDSLSVGRQAIPSRGFDRARARCNGGALALETARSCVTQAGLYGTAPATASWLAGGLGAQVAMALGAAPAARDAVESSYRHPHVGVLTSSKGFSPWRDDELRVEVSDERSARFFGYLEARSEHGWGEAAWLSLSLAATKTRPGMTRWHAEPDLLDVLLATTRGDTVMLARLFDDFAQQSLFAARDVGTSVEYGWRLTSDSLPRNVALPDPLEPTGSGYLRIDLTPSDRARVVAFQMRCESPVSYVWSVVRLGAKDELLSSVEIAYRERGGEVDARVTPQDGVQSLVLVGTNMGGIDLAHPFDPDHEPHEAHGCQVYMGLVDS